MTRRTIFLLSRLAFAFLVSILGSASSVRAQELGYRSFGLRGGLSVNPDQFAVGAHLDLGTLAKQIRLQPSFDIGFGDDVTVGTINIDAHYLFKASGSTKPYAGGGVTIALIDVDPGFRDQFFGDSDIEAGVSLVGGVQWGRPQRGSRAAGRYLLEGRLGVGDVPDFKLLFGINF